MTDLPETQYAKTADGVHVAYQATGSGRVPLVFAFASGGHLEREWDGPLLARFLRRLGSFTTLIRFDVRGTGLSDPVHPNQVPTLEQRAQDLLAVLDAVGVEQVALLGNGVGGFLMTYVAASHPERVSALILAGAFARLTQAADYPWGMPERMYAAVLDRAERREVDWSRVNAPSISHDRVFGAWYRQLRRQAEAPGFATADTRMLLNTDVRLLLPSVQAPTLVLYRPGDPLGGSGAARFLADHIAEARLVELPGSDNLIFVGESDSVLEEIQDFLTGSRHALDSDRVLASVLFTDIVGSTEKAAELGDRRWRDLLDAHHHVVRTQLDLFRGREIKTAGDGFLATFDGPGRAIHCAQAVTTAVRPLGVEVRAGIHTGEIELHGQDVAGIAVHIAARVASRAAAGEVLVSSAVPPLVAGSGITFIDKGEHHLKGVPGVWNLLAATTAPRG